MKETRNPHKKNGRRNIKGNGISLYNRILSDESDFRKVWAVGYQVSYSNVIKKSKTNDRI